MEIQLCANGAKNTMSPSKHKKRRSTKPKEMYIPDVVVIPPAAQSKHLFDDFTIKTMQSSLANPSVDEGDSIRQGKKRRQRCQQIIYQNTILIDRILLLRTFNNVCFKDRIHAVKISEKKQKKNCCYCRFLYLKAKTDNWPEPLIRRSIYQCSLCKVHLCLDHFHIFHKT